MSEKAEEFAGRLRESTQAGKLNWSAVPDQKAEADKFEADDGISFSVKRVARGDDKIVTIEMAESGRVALADSESNIDSVANSALVREQALSFMLSRRSESQPSAANDAQSKRFRLDSDLFPAAQETAEGQDQTIEKAQQFLSRLA
jgi:hypothetical protein